MAKSTHNLRSNLLLLLFAISSFSLFAQNDNAVNRTTLKTNNDQTGTTQIQTNTSTVNGRLILHSSTTGALDVREVPHRGLQIDNGSIYGDDMYTSAGDVTNSGSQTSSLVNCPMMYVQVNIPFLQSCIHSSAQINYCNHGTATAFGAFVDVEVPAELFLDSTELPYTVVGTNLYRFHLGTVGVSTCNQFEIYFTTDCDSNLIGEEHCINAHIYPDTLCNSVQSTPLITVEATCIAGKTNFTLNNHGTAVTMDQHMELIIIEDHLLVGGVHPKLLDDTLELESDGSLELVSGDAFSQSYTSSLPNYLLTVTDGLGNQLVHSRVSNCAVGSSSIEINTSHAQQYVDQLGNGGVLPSISQGCAENGASGTQTNSTFAPTNTNSSPNGGDGSSSKNDAVDFMSLESAETTVLVFPNPFSQYATVRIEGSISDRFMFRLYDATGKTVQMIEIEDQREFQIQRGNLLQGMYLYQIESEGQLIDAGKIIIK